MKKSFVGIDSDFFSALSLRSLRLCGELICKINTPQRRRERRGYAEKWRLCLLILFS